jgi:hypothetical protein
LSSFLTLFIVPTLFKTFIKEKKKYNQNWKIVAPGLTFRA